MDGTGSGRVLLAAPRGTCAGVDRAVRGVEEALRRNGAPVYVRKHIVHNRYTVERLERQGAVFVSEVDEIPVGATVLISAHGASPVVFAEAGSRGLHVVDATCPLVSKIHTEARRLTADGYQIVYIGQNGHDEVEGVVGEAPEDITVISGVDDVADLHVQEPSRLAWLTQTTLSVDETRQVVDEIRARFPLVRGPASDDICYAAQNRQSSIRTVAARADLVLVVGSAHSHNSRQLVKVALAAGAPAAYLVDSYHAIEPHWLDHVATVGLTAGASAPEVLVTEVLAWLADRGYSTVEEVGTTREPMRFAAPRGLARES